MSRKPNPINDPNGRGGHPAKGPPPPEPTPRPTWLPPAAERTERPRPDVKPPGGQAYRPGPVVRS
jgi:hypothetical protein